MFLAIISDKSSNYQLISSINFKSLPPQMSSGTTEDEWMMFHGNLNHTGFTETIPIRKNATIWSYPADDVVWSSPAIYNGMVYVGNDDCKIYCFNATTGYLIWSYMTKDMVDSSPAVYNGMVYVGSYDGKIYCLDAITGDLIWSYTTGDWVYSSPAIANGMVYFGSVDYNIYCLNATSGAQIWTYSTDDAIWSSPAVYNGMVYVGSDDCKIYCLDAITGNLIWSYITEDWVDSSPAVYDGMVYVGSYDGNLYCLNATSGIKIWNYTTEGSIWSSPAIAYGFVFVGSYDGNLYCLNATSGIKIWNYTTGDWVISSPAVANGMVYVGSFDYNIYGFNAISGKYLGNFSTDSFIWSSPAIANGLIYLGSCDCKFYCLPFFNGPASTPLDFNLTSGNKQITLRWDPPSDDGGYPITNYSIYRGTSSGTETYLTSVSAPLTSYVDSGLNSESYYYYKITAVNNGGEGPNSTEVLAKASTIPTEPLDFQLNQDDEQITLSWQIPSSDGGSIILGYKIYRGYSSGNNIYITTIDNSTTYIDTDISDNTTYYYKVSAINNNGEGIKSSEISTTTFTYSAPPINLQAIPGENQITLSWQTPSNNGGSVIVGYKIYGGTSSNNEIYLVSVGNVNNYTDANLLSNTTYYYKISSINGIGEGIKSSEISITTLASSSNSIGGMDIAAILLLSFVGVCIVVITARKRLK